MTGGRGARTFSSGKVVVKGCSEVCREYQTLQNMARKMQRIQRIPPDCSLHDMVWAVDHILNTWQAAIEAVVHQVPTKTVISTDCLLSPHLFLPLVRDTDNHRSHLHNNKEYLHKKANKYSFSV